MTGISTMKTSNKILLLGNPILYSISEEVKREEVESLKPVIKGLHDALMQFREQYKRGRAIAAPQIGILKRIIYMHIDQPIVMINPQFTWKNPEMIDLWDDCMSFPDLLVKVSRHQSCRLKFLDMDWQEHEWDLSGDLSELLQHEYDHLDGILATMKAIDGQSFALYSQKKYIDFAR
jgi:peptide deformylase